MNSEQKHYRPSQYGRTDSVTVLASRNVFIPSLYLKGSGYSDWAVANIARSACAKVSVLYLHHPNHHQNQPNQAYSHDFDLNKGAANGGWLRGQTFCAGREEQ